MNNLKFKTTFLLFGLAASPVWAQAAQAPQSPDSFSFVNILLAFVALALATAILTISGVIKGISNTPELLDKIKDSELKKTAKALIGAIFVLGSATAVKAQNLSAAVDDVSHPQLGTATVVLIVLNCLLIIALLYVYGIQKGLVNRIVPPQKPSVKDAKVPDAPSSFAKVLTDAVPVEREDEIMLDHSYDGIRELDNNLPPWWVWMFYATIAYSVIYLLYFDVLSIGKTQKEEYLAELEQAKIQKEQYLATQKDLVDENTVVYLDDAKDLAAGKNIYMTNCQACHAPDGGGGVGPNFTDDYWLHGGSINDIFKTIKYGVPTKGMIAWESQLNPTQMAQVASFVKSLHGTSPANPKEPQGELWNPGDGAEAPPDSDASKDGDVSDLN